MTQRSVAEDTRGVAGRLPFDDQAEGSHDHGADVLTTLPVAMTGRASPAKAAVGDKPVVAYVVLLRGINVGGKNKVPMAPLRALLEDLGFSNVTTYIASGNVILNSDRQPAEIKRRIEEALPKTLRLDSELVGVRVLTQAQLRAVIEHKPEGFGEQPDRYHSDVIFLMGIDSGTAMQVFDPRPGVDRVWPGDGVIYSQRLSAQRTKSRLSKIVGSAAYKSMTIRNWATTLALLRLAESADAVPEDVPASAPRGSGDRRRPT